MNKTLLDIPIFYYYYYCIANQKSVIQKFIQRKFEKNKFTRGRMTLPDSLRIFR